MNGYADFHSFHNRGFANVSAGTNRVFTRKGKYWDLAPHDIEMPEHYNKMAAGWLISLLHNIDAKQSGELFEARGLHLTGVMRTRWMHLYSKTYKEVLDKDGTFNADLLAMRTANEELRKRFENVENRFA